MCDGVSSPPSPRVPPPPLVVPGATGRGGGGVRCATGSTLSGCSSDTFAPTDVVLPPSGTSSSPHPSSSTSACGRRGGEGGQPVREGGRLVDREQTQGLVGSASAAQAAVQEPTQASQAAIGPIERASRVHRDDGGLLPVPPRRRIRDLGQECRRRARRNSLSTAARRARGRAAASDHTKTTRSRCMVSSARCSSPPSWR